MTPPNEVESGATRPEGLNGFLSGFVKGFRIRNAVRELAEAESVLDLGSGLCEVIGHLRPGIRYCGVERDPWMLARARRLFPRCSFMAGDLEDPGFEPPEPAGNLLLLAVFEHLADPAGFLRRALRWTPPGGRLVLTTPHPRSATILEVGARWGLLSSAADEEHERLWGPVDIRKAAEEAGWSVRRYSTFLLGLNQLFVLERPGAGSSPGSASKGSAG